MLLVNDVVAGREIKQLKVAWQELYAALSDEQKKEADNLVLPMMGMGGPGMMGGPGAMGPGMMGGGGGWRR